MLLRRWILGTLMGCSVIPALNADFFSIYKSLVKITVETTSSGKVNARGEVEKSYQSGTGFYVDANGIIATAYHVIKGQSSFVRDPIECRDLDTDKSFHATVVAWDEEKDIALLERPLGGNSFYIDVSKKSRQGVPSTLYCMGIPNEIRMRSRSVAISRGRLLKESADLMGAETIKKRKNVILAECEVWEGFSGGLMVDGDFSVVGIIIGSIEGKGKPQCFGRRLSDIANLMEAQLGPNR